MSRVYELIIKNETDSAAAKQVGGAGGIQTNDGAGDSSGGEKSKPTSAEKALKQLFGYKAVKSVASQVISFQVSTVQLRTGSSEAQQKANFWYNVAQRGLSVGESLIGGALVGGLPGAIIGLAVGAAHTAIDIGQRIERMDMEKRVEDVSRDISAQRATVSGSRYQNVTQ